MAAIRPSAVVVWKSLTLVTTSPACRPALSAGPPETTLCSGTPTPLGCSDSVPPTVTPSAAFFELPWSIRSVATRSATSDGMAKPMPMLPDWLFELDPVLAIEELMPTTAPLRSTRGPPELPGLIAASVCTARYTASFLLPDRTGRAVLDTMPLVTDSDRPRGAPAATTAWPTCSESDLAKTAGVRFCCPSTLMTARSLVSELPTTVAGTVRPSPKVTVMVPPSEAPSTTCALVRMWPSLSMTTPLPRPPLPPLCTLMVTSEGSILAAAAPTVPSSLGLWAAGRVLTPIGEVADPDAEVR